MKMEGWMDELEIVCIGQSGKEYWTRDIDIYIEREREREQRTLGKSWCN